MRAWLYAYAYALLDVILAPYVFGRFRCAKNRRISLGCDKAGEMGYLLICALYKGTSTVHVHVIQHQHFRHFAASGLAHLPPALFLFALKGPLML